MLKSIINRAPIGLAVADSSGQILVSNEKAQETQRTHTIELNGLGEKNNFLGYHPDGQAYQHGNWPVARSILNGEVISGEEIHIHMQNDQKRSGMAIPFWA